MSSTQTVTRAQLQPQPEPEPSTSASVATHTPAATSEARTPHSPDVDEDRRRIKLSVRLVETVRHFFDLGVTSFGGPGVHVIVLRKRFVNRLKWLDETTFADLFSLGNALPGPGSTQLAFSIAVVRNGTLAGFLAFLLWSIPGAVGMAALGAGVRKFPERLPPIVLGLLTGLNAAAVGLIALAAFQLSKSSITDPITRLLVLSSTSFGICYHAPWMYPVLVFVGGFITLLYDFRRRILGKLPDKLNPYKIAARRARAAAERVEPVLESTTDQDIELEPVATAHETPNDVDKIATRSTRGSVHELRYSQDNNPAARSGPSRTSSLRQRTSRPEATSTPATPRDDDEDMQSPDLTRRTPIMVLNKKLALMLGALFLAFVITVVVVRSELKTPPRALDFFTNMVIAGVIIFGGGPVVIPLLRGYTVENGWVESRDFLLGFAILQAFPGPNFNFAAYLGVLSLPGNPVLGAFLGWLGIFFPGILLKLSLLPIYNTWRKHAVAISILRGLNAAATGLVYTAVWQLFLVGYIYTPATGQVVQAASQSGPLTSDPFWGVVASSAFVASQWFKLPPAFAIVGGALGGLAWYGVVGSAGTERQQLM
ncbi:hypothetical protein BCV70DRAFT_202706 [Testicularia cyperi]|uniref:Chromate ion transporter n=1 Tax=Testicularia cyperi TaxID=1882483 RepID=A0A317XH99_9BASI|nr:hypothetical protein BCV70DRAFT_202706 [Testicularia cyperi]